MSEDYILDDFEEWWATEKALGEEDEKNEKKEKRKGKNKVD
jgi:hypothetical protein